MTNREYLDLSSTERPEVTRPMTHGQFREFAITFNPSYAGISNGTAYRLTEELLRQACLRIAELEGTVAGLRAVVGCYQADRADQQLSDLEIEELGKNGIYYTPLTAEQTSGESVVVDPTAHYEM